MKNNKEQVLINLVTTKDELSSLFKNLINSVVNEQLKEHRKVNAPSDKAEKLRTIQYTANFFGVSSTTIHAWKNKKILPYLKINSRIRFRDSDLVALYEKRGK